MTNQELYKQAILDAKAVRETALAAARETLAEAFEPRIKEMMRLKLAEDATEETMDEAESTATRDDHAEKAGKKVAKDIEYDEKHGKFNEAEDMEESTLDEILAELDALSEETDDTMEEAKEKMEEGEGTTAGYDEKARTVKGETGYDEKAKVSHGDHKLHEADDDKEDEDAEADDEAEEAGEDLTHDIEGAHDESTEVVDITVGDLKDIIRDVFMQLQGGGDEELDALDVDSPGQAVADDAMAADEDDAEISLESILAELDKEDKKMEEAAEVPGSIKTSAADAYKVDEIKKDLHEAHKAIKAMKHELNEVNLLNAKLLYVNKIFKAKSLNESQKVKVLNAFDRATSIKEVENTYKTLNESIGEASKKSSLKESVGFASKPIGSAPARPIVDADPYVNRWQTLAGIK
jgi:hypothetical protein